MTIHFRLNRKVTVALASLAMAAAGGTWLSTATTGTAGAAINGSHTLLSKANETLTSDLPTCEYQGDNCRSYNLALHQGQYFQAQLNSPTSESELVLYDDLGTKLEETSVNSQGSGYIEEKVTRTGTYRLAVASDDQMHYDVFAFETPQTLKHVAVPVTISNQFSKVTTRQVSGKDVTYWDGVTFNGRKDRRVSIVFSKPGDDEVMLTLYDSFGNKLDEYSGDASAKITYQLPYSGGYQVGIGGGTTGRYTLRITDPDAPVRVASVHIARTMRTLRMNRKVRLTAIVAPSNATHKTVTWRSSRPAIASVNRIGVVTGRKRGRAIITATTVDGHKVASVVIKVRR